METTLSLAVIVTLTQKKGQGWVWRLHTSHLAWPLIPGGMCCLLMHKHENSLIHLYTYRNMKGGHWQGQITYVFQNMTLI